MQRNTMKYDLDFKHLKNVNAGYFKHFILASWFNIIALCIVVTGLIHSIFPFVFAFTPYKLAKYIVDKTENSFGKPK